MRDTLVKEKLLWLYTKMDRIQYPICPKSLLALMPKRTVLETYQTVSKKTGTSVLEVAKAFRSMYGFVQYDPEIDCCLILYNADGNSREELWTICHELGHISLWHFDLIRRPDWESKLYPIIEPEADYFANHLMAPFPVMLEMGIRDAGEVREVYGMTEAAAERHFAEFQRWLRNHPLNDADRELIRLFREKYEK